MPDVSPFTQVIEASAPAVSTAGATDDTVLAQAPYACTVTAVQYVPEAAVTGANTNTRTVSLVNKGADGTGTTTVASLALTSGVNLTANDERALTLSATAAHLVLAAGDTLQWRSVHSGTGLADPGGIVRIHFARNYA